MAKGLKMTRAFKGGHLLEIENLSKDDNGRIFCEDSKCRTHIEYNSGYPIKATNTVVAPYLKLAKGREHSDNCKNSISGAVKIFVSESSDIEDVPNIFESKADGTFTLRLNLLEQSKSDLDKLVDKNSNSDSVEPKVGKDYVKTEKRLSSYCKSATGIARIRSLIQESSDAKELEALIKIEFKNQQVEWKDFFYDDARYHVLHNRIARGKIEHPVAIRVTAKQTRTSTNTTHPVSTQCYSEAKDGINYIPWLNIHRDLEDIELTSGNAYIVLGHVTSSHKGQFKGLNFKIGNKKQIARE
ncbi:hypothetical protein [Vibrio anguillarum]|uniref:Uncharacterized protein n=27 Tax=Vibrio TaxID=662 RepID=A0AAW4BHC3_VIBAN|nr:hypothetical protein [Vibrio anguillarum]ASG05504.1 hypothetical protein CEJ46_17100 [Vibrio anguillarum]MBF4358708.1 hypothetical protein [Vibrio anguillarum]MBF4436467.1 hypothetical protein [Vibrio anguillarum]MBT2920604.1 hypothetical protein [Vibrio anguillarum]